MKKNELNNCRICKSGKLIKYLDLGHHPYSNSFLYKKNFAKEIKYPLELVLCSKCSLSQLSIVPDTKSIFKDYDYLSSSSKALSQHYENLVKKIINKFEIKSGDTVVDIGCNDGVLLNHYRDKSINIVGIEPSNVIKKIKNKKIKIINKFFNYKTSQYYKKKFNNPKVITITNVLAQIDNLRDFIKGVKSISDKKTILIIEFPYSLTMIKKTFFDLIYHEHLSYFNLTSIKYLFDIFDFSLIDYDKIDLGASGPALRIYLAKKDSTYQKNLKKINDQLSVEKNWNVKNISKYMNFSVKVKKKINEVREIIYYFRKKIKLAVLLLLQKEIHYLIV